MKGELSFVLGCAATISTNMLPHCLRLRAIVVVRSISEYAFHTDKPRLFFWCRSVLRKLGGWGQ